LGSAVQVGPIGKRKNGLLHVKLEASKTKTRTVSGAHRFEIKDDAGRIWRDLPGMLLDDPKSPNPSTKQDDHRQVIFTESLPDCKLQEVRQYLRFEDVGDAVDNIAIRGQEDAVEDIPAEPSAAGPSAPTAGPTAPTAGTAAPTAAPAATAAGTAAPTAAPAATTAAPAAATAAPAAITTGPPGDKNGTAKQGVVKVAKRGPAEISTGPEKAVPKRRKSVNLAVAVQKSAAQQAAAGLSLEPSSTFGLGDGGHGDCTDESSGTR